MAKSERLFLTPDVKRLVVYKEENGEKVPVVTIEEGVAEPVKMADGYNVAVFFEEDDPNSLTYKTADGHVSLLESIADD